MGSPAAKIAFTRKDFNTGTSAGTWTLCGTTYLRNIVGVVADIDGEKGIAGRVYVQTQASGAFYEMNRPGIAGGCLV